jgi:hypothetical protein
MIQAVWPMLLFPFSLFLLSNYMKPTEGERNPRDLAAGLLGVVTTAFFLHGTYSLVFVRLPHAAVLFRTVRGVVGGAFASTLLSTVFSKGARNTLILSSILFVTSPLALLLVLHRTAPGVTLQAILLSPNLCGLESCPVGLAIPAIVVFWRSGGNYRGAQKNIEPAQTGRIGEDGTGT